MVALWHNSSTRVWTYREMEIVEVDVALSHASVLEESQLMRQNMEE